MYCGAKKIKIEKAITMRELLNKIPDSVMDAKVIINNNEKYYIHFSLDADEINLDTRPWDIKYGESSDGNSCLKCARYNKEEKACKCDGKSCMNYQLLVSDKSVLNKSIYTEVKEEAKLDNTILLSKPEEIELSKPSLPIDIIPEENVNNNESIVAPDEDLLAINGIISSSNNTSTVAHDIHKVEESAPILKEEPKVNKEESSLENIVQSAMVNVLNKMIKALED